MSSVRNLKNKKIAPLFNFRGLSILITDTKPLFYGGGYGRDC